VLNKLPRAARWLVLILVSAPPALAGIAAVYVMWLSSLAAIGTVQAAAGDPREGITHGILTPLLWVAQDRKAFVIRVCRWHAAQFVSELGKRPDIRYAVVLSKLSPEFAKPSDLRNAARYS